MRSRLRASLVLFVVVLMAELETGQTECCHPVCGAICKDCTIGTPYCAYDRCNIFGCNCGGGCRRGKPCNRGCIQRGKRDVLSNQNNDDLEEDNETSEQTLDAIFKSADRNRDGFLDEPETATWLRGRHRGQRGVIGGRQARSVTHHFQEMDLNGDGFLSRNEIDD